MTELGLLVGLAVLLGGCRTHPLPEAPAPVGQTERHVYERTVSIAAPLDRVWRYLGNSAHAREWSVYHHHITPLDTSRTGRPLPPEDTVGAVRVCYRRADESGPVWDERLIDLDSTGTRRVRRIHAYRFRGFGGLPGLMARHTAYYETQIYRGRGDSTRLTFRVRLAHPNNAPMRWAFAAHVDEVMRLFELNLENIKAAVEARHQGHPYVRPHPYMTDHYLD